MKVGIKSSPCGPNELGYTCATMKITNSKINIFYLIYKNFLSSDCKLQLVYMKSESLVIANQNVAVNGKLALYTPPVTCGKLTLFEELLKTV